MTLGQHIAELTGRVSALEAMLAPRPTDEDFSVVAFVENALRAEVAELRADRGVVTALSERRLSEIRRLRALMGEAARVLDGRGAVIATVESSEGRGA